MSYFDAIILGIIQGITEFLPISSTGHLILIREFFNIDFTNSLAIDATLHFATALAVILYFREDIVRLLKSLLFFVQRKPVDKDDSVLILAILIGTIPAVFLGLLLESSIESVFRTPERVAWVLIIGSVLFVIAEKVHAHFLLKTDVSVKRGLIIGLFQALALFPGMSRSGATISGGMLLGLSREGAARFAFLLSIPIILGAGSKKMLELGTLNLPLNEWFVILIACVTAFVFGIFSIHYLLKFLRKYSLMPFVYYRVALALIVFLFI